MPSKYHFVTSLVSLRILLIVGIESNIHDENKSLVTHTVCNLIYKHQFTFTGRIGQHDLLLRRSDHLSTEGQSSVLLMRIPSSSTCKIIYLNSSCEETFPILQRLSCSCFRIAISHICLCHKNKISCSVMILCS